MAKITKQSPLAPARFPQLPQIDGVRFATAQAGVRYQGRTDVMLAELVAGTAIAGTFTRSATRSAAVLDCQEKIGGANDAGAAIIVNSGNANAFTGSNGRKAAKAVTTAVADMMDLPEARVFSSSTGVIGEVLPDARITAKIAELKDGLDVSAIEPAARAIMTTDTFPKGASEVLALDGAKVTIAGFAKGSGMIAPNMATMLAYVFTDAAIAPDLLQGLLEEVTNQTFNNITVDGDTSTSDTLMVFATGANGMAEIATRDDPRFAEFATALKQVCLDLSHLIVKDGEGASKFVTITVEGAVSETSAKVVACSIANSPLIKTAMAAGDANWGRIVMAVGKSLEPIDMDQLAIWFDDVQVASAGGRMPDYSEAAAGGVFAQPEFTIRVHLGVGEASATVWTCDLTHGYVDINGAYRT